MKSVPKQIMIIGVTACGKGRLAFQLARDIGAEIISVDSMKVYRRMDIGTAKPPAEVRKQIKYHLIDIVEPSESFNVAAFTDLANTTASQILASGKPVIASGGTALYIKAMLYGLFEGPGSDEVIRDQFRQREKEVGLAELYNELKKVDPQASERIHANDSKRILRALEVYQLTGKPISSFQTQFAKQPMHGWKIIGIRRTKESENGRINLRVKKMMEQGLVDEVKSLLAEEMPLSKQARCAIGYAEIIDHLQGKMSLDDAVELIKKNTRYLAKHQRTWFKTFPDVHWLDINDGLADEEIFPMILEALS